MLHDDVEWEVETAATSTVGVKMAEVSTGGGGYWRQRAFFDDTGRGKRHGK